MRILKKPLARWRALALPLLSAALLGPVTAQVNYTTSFDGCSATPCGGWAITGGFQPDITSVAATGYTPCNTASAKTNLYSGATSTSLTSSSLGVSNGEPIAVDFTYRLMTYSSGGASAANDADIYVEWSTTGGDPWTAVAGTPFIRETSATCTPPPAALSFTPPLGQNVYVRLRAVWFGGDYWMVFDDVSVVQALGSACDATPAPGATLSTSMSACPGGTVSLSLENTTSGSGVSHQWYSSTDGGITWEEGPSTTAWNDVTINEETSFYCAVTCDGEGTGNSDEITVGITDDSCMCAAYEASMSTGCCEDDSNILAVTVGSMSNTYDCMTVAPGPGSVLHRYQNYTTSVAGPSLMQSTTVGASVLLGNCDGSSAYDKAFAVWVDWDQNGVFDHPAEQVFLSGVSSAHNTLVAFDIDVPVSAATGSTRLRVVMMEGNPPALLPSGTYLYGDVHDYCVTVVAGEACDATPTPGATLSTNASVCANETVNLSLQNATTGSGVSYQWYSSTDGGITWEEGPTTAAWNDVTINEETSFYCAVTCAGEGTADSDEITVGLNPANTCYCATVNFTFDVEPITRVQFAGIDQSSCAPVGCDGDLVDYTAGTPGSVEAGLGYTIVVEGNTGGTWTNHFTAFFDWDQDGVFEDAQPIGSISTSTGLDGIQATNTMNVPITALGGSTRMRVVKNFNTSPMDPCGTYGYGQAEDYTLNVTPSMACDATPTPGAAVSTSMSVCPGGTVSLSLENTTSGSGVSHQWYSSTDGGITWEEGPTTAVWNDVTINEETSFYCAVTCDGEGTGNSGEVTVGLNPANECYCDAGATNTTFEKISNVLFAGIDQASPATPAPGYEDFTAVEGNVSAGASYPIEIFVSNSWSPDLLYVWIDYDQNGEFDEVNELAFTAGPPNLGNNQPWTATGTITIPPGATAGQTRMRIRLQDPTSPPANATPCGNSAFGQVEDYTLNISVPTCVFPGATATIVPVCPGFDVDVDVTSFGDGSQATIAYSVNSVPQTPIVVSSLGITTLGGFATNDVVAITVQHESDGDCNLSLGNHTYACPPGSGCGAYTSNPNITIPTTAPPNVHVDQIVIGSQPAGTVITDLNVFVDISHTWGGDVRISLTSPSGTTVALLANGYCGSADNVVVEFDDAAAGLIGSACPLAGTFRPNNPLSAFNMEPLEGTWTMTVSDMASGDGGTWNSWCLIPQTMVYVCEYDLVMELQTDSWAGETSWAIIQDDLNLTVCTGSGYPNNAIVTAACCVAEGCYRLEVYDSFGDGMSLGTGAWPVGGYILRTVDGERIIDNAYNFDDGAISTLVAGESFCLPLGVDRTIHTSCDRYWWESGNYLVATENAAVSAEFGVSNTTSGYEFWFFDPNGGYSFRKFRNHATSDGFAPNNAMRAAHIKLNNWAAENHLENDRLYNVRIRGVINGEELAYGPACRVVLDPVAAACTPTGLNDITGHANFSCGVSRTFGGPNSPANRVYARSVAGANRYEFEFSNPGESYLVSVFSNTVIRHLNWVSQPGLNVGSIYQVRVRASKDGGATWCNWGWTCDVTIAPGVAPGGESFAALGQTGVALWPNPNNGQQLWMEVDGLTDDIRTIAVDIHDLSGKRVVAREVAAQHGAFSLDLNGGIAAGTYVVTITAGDQRHVERLVIAD